ncbi:hypothetical protein ACFS4T_12705 [Pseudomonas lini]
MTFDVFGFSRGAAAARHFACLCLSGTNSPLRETLYLPNSLFDRGFSKVFGEGVNVGFIGLFDTVASLGGLSNLGNVRSPATPGGQVVFDAALLSQCFATGGTGRIPR